MSGITSILVSFPVEVELTKDEYQAFCVAITTICKRYEKEHPGRVCWLFSEGALMTHMPVTDDEAAQFDDSVQHFQVSEREK